MPVGNVDYDRGVLIMLDPVSGMDVFMYVDSPGVYLTAHSKPVPEEIAKRAGYDVEKLAKDRLKGERKAQALRAIEEEMADEKDMREDVVCEDASGFKVITTGMGRHHVIDPDGNQLTRLALPKESALKLLRVMVDAETAPSSKVEVSKPAVAVERKGK